MGPDVMVKDNTPRTSATVAGSHPVPEVHDDREIRKVTADSRFRLFHG